MKTFFTAVLVFVAANVQGQGWAENTRFQTGSWSILNVKCSIAPKFNLFAEAQVRSQESLNDFNYWECKLIGHYLVSDQFFLGGGVGTYHQFQDYDNFEGPQKQKEFRIWQEMVTKNSIGRFNFDHRYRIEERFIQKYDATLKDYTNNYSTKLDDDRYRFRYRIQLNVPINHAKMQANTLYFNTSNEIHLTHKKPYFIQNRFFVGFGYKLKNTQIQAGLMHQFLNGNTFARTKNYVQIAYTFNIPGTLIKKKETK